MLLPGRPRKKGPQPLPNGRGSVSRCALRQTAFRVLTPIVVVLQAVAAEAPLPELRIEPTTGGSIFYVKNVSPQPLTGLLIELVDYPGSSYSLWRDEIAEPILPGVEKRIPVSNMTVGAVPDYVKIQAALFADGTSSGIPEKVAQFMARRRAILETTRELIRRIESGQVAGLKQWAESIAPPGRSNRNSQAAIDNAASRSLIGDTIARIESHSAAGALTALRASEHALAASKPAL
jgi:hypothetical protein